MASLTRAVTRLAATGRQAIRSIATTTPVSGHGDDVMEKWPADSKCFRVFIDFWEQRAEAVVKRALNKHYVQNAMFFLVI